MRLARPLLRRLRDEPDLCIGENEPYGGHLPGDAIDKHAIAHRRLNALIEFRNDLIAEAAHQHLWATRVAPILQAALLDADQPVPA